MADEDDKKNPDLTVDTAASGGTEIVYADPYPRPTRLINNTPDNYSLATQGGADPSAFVVLPNGSVRYNGPLLVDENNNLTPQTEYDGDTPGYTFVDLSRNPAGIQSFLTFLHDYNYYGSNKPSSQAMAGIGMTNADEAAMMNFMSMARYNGKTWKAYMSDVMRNPKPKMLGTGGRTVSVTAPEDIARQYLDATYKILGRPATQQEMQSAITWVQNQERQRAAGGRVDAATLASAAQSAASQASPGEATAQKVGSAINAIMNLLGGR
jgi:hypothetical protein